MSGYLASEHPVRLAHRGSGVLWPENTMHAFQKAVDMGYRYLETDVRCSADGVLYAFHDQTLERCTGGLGPIAEWRSDELDRLDAAFWFDAPGGYPLRGAGIGIPRLDDVLASFPGVHVNVDMKSADSVAPLAALVAGRRVEERVLAGSFSDRRISRFRRLTAGRVATSAGPAEAAACWIASRAGIPWRSPALALQLPARARGRQVVDRRVVGWAHAAGKQVHVWTVDDAPAMRRFLALGVDGIVTNRPDVLNEVLAGGAPRR